VYTQHSYMYLSKLLTSQTKTKAMLDAGKSSQVSANAQDERNLQRPQSLLRLMTEKSLEYDMCCYRGKSTRKEAAPSGTKEANAQIAM
jgi:hypothetical protein